MPAFIRAPSWSSGWSLTRVDRPSDEDVLEGMFPPQDEGSTRSVRWTTINILTARRPRQQYAGGDLDTFGFTAMFINETVLDDVSSKVDKINKWAEPDPDVGRPPILRYACGERSFTGVIESVQTRVSERHFDGRVKSFVCSIQMREAPVPAPIGITIADPTAPPHRSYYKVMPAGATYETVALERYRDPVLGIFVRQDSFIAFPAVGEIAFFPRRQNFRSRVFGPDSHTLTASPTVQAVLEARFREAAGTTRVRGPG